MSDCIYLTAKFKEKGRVTALRAKWDPQAAQWYVPDGLDLASFAFWLPVGAFAEALRVVSPASSSASRELYTQVKGVALSWFLSGVAMLVANRFWDVVWTTAEVLKASATKGKRRANPF